MDGGHARQQHGLNFEKWILDTFFDYYETDGPTGKWDASNVVYKDEFKDKVGAFQGLPVSIKTCGKSSAIGFGDALRQYTVEQDFLLIVGFWEGKRYTSVQAVVISKSEWHELFHEVVTKEELQNDTLSSDDFGKKLKDFDSLIKDRSKDYRIVRNEVKKAKAKFGRMSISLNPKIDSKGQRRLQCSLGNRVYLNTFGKRSARAVCDKDGDLAFFGAKVPSKK